MADLPPLVALLAAGGATRFGGGKLDADCAGKPVGQWAIDAAAAAGFAPGVIVVSQSPPQFAQVSGWSLLTNTCAHEGLGTSIAHAAEQALAQSRPLLVALADMPMIPPTHLAALAAGKGISATLYPGGKTGVPAFFPLEHLPAIAALDGDAGAGALLTGRSDVARIGLTAEQLLDVDRPADLARAAVLLSQRG